MRKLAEKIFKTTRNILLLLFVIPDFVRFKSKAKQVKSRFSTKLKDFYPQIMDKTLFTGFDRHYIYHTAWAARKLAQIRPAVHIDISSSLYFCGIVSAFLPVKFYDFRPAKLELNNLSSARADLLSLPFATGSIKSLSCMHTVEHIGLGRYGDSIDPEADLKAISELQRVLAKEGSLLFVVPVGKPKIMFNAHRIYAYAQIMEYFADLQLKEFALIPEAGPRSIIYNAPKELADLENYGCGCFWFVKP